MAKRARTTKRKRSAKKKATPPVDITPIVERAQLRGLRLRKSEFVLMSVPKSAPELTQGISIEVGREAPEDKTFVVQATFTLDGADLMRIEATFELVYECEAANTVSPQQMQAFGQAIGLSNAWPYWREFVQTITCRMGLPALTLPLMKIDFRRPEKKGNKPKRTKRVSAKTKRKKA